VDGDLSGGAPPRGRVCVFPDAEYDAAAAREVARLLTTAIGDRGVAAIALAGGATPESVYAHLAGHGAIRWARVHVYFGDERAVPPAHPDSNLRMARAALLDHVAIPPAQVFRMEADSPDLETAAFAYERVLPDALDVIVLGIGADGHTASLFPHAPALREQTRRVVPVPRPPADHARLSVTPPVIRAARARVVLARGPSKAGPVATALTGSYDPVECPAQLARDGVWLLDQAAATGIRQEGA